MRLRLRRLARPGVFLVVRFGVSQGPFVVCRGCRRNAALLRLAASRDAHIGRSAAPLLRSAPAPACGSPDLGCGGHNPHRAQDPPQSKIAGSWWVGLGAAQSIACWARGIRRKVSPPDAVGKLPHSDRVSGSVPRPALVLRDHHCPSRAGGPPSRCAPTWTPPHLRTSRSARFSRRQEPCAALRRDSRFRPGLARGRGRGHRLSLVPARMPRTPRPAPRCRSASSCMPRAFSPRRLGHPPDCACLGVASPNPSSCVTLACPESSPPRLTTRWRRRRVFVTTAKAGTAYVQMATARRHRAAIDLPGFRRGAQLRSATDR